ncbi:gamma-glutamylcyclotransferase family protein [Lichenibacterium ramalinae]|uniref:Gamma-glutamylcyclotransferase n=1 Tax=Lichenibacterium ramalinae TaxID=2316527 RepID=A0A4Q2RE41_9HYPH|nr:gamma-glutamylcyclotransferase family protein [Lichenibacterium ramalinae]RYB04774.1 gamma-glutamylcyclotransferase [Lichenibacterium ramalinae]
MLYFAYGSNMNRADMRARCPAAVPLGPAHLPDHALVFRAWADVVPRAGSRVAGGLWRITPACAAALDLYEDVADGLYRRLLLPVLAAEGDAPGQAPVHRQALVYRMAGTHEAPPDPGYLATIVAGCRDFGIDAEPVLAAAARAASGRDGPT